MWAYLESERFLHPVLRQFYKERNVVIEERRMRVDSDPEGRLFEQFTEEAFAAHPYHRPTIGWISDLNSFSATDAQNFFDKYYVPSNMVVAVVGDVKASEAMPIVEKYFSRIPARPKPDTATTTEPAQNSERSVVLHEQSQPIYIEGYHRPDYRSPDDQVYDAISDLMSSGDVYKRQACGFRRGHARRDCPRGPAECAVVGRLHRRRSGRKGISRQAGSRRIRANRD